MKIVFDEAGNTGCVVTNRSVLNFKDQPVFSLCGLLLNDEQDEIRLVELYSDFLRRNKILGEIKGSELMKRENNEILFDFISNVLDATHFSFNIYDKKFYLASLICVAILGNDLQLEFTNEFYSIVGALAFENDDFFFQYCEFAKDVNAKSLHSFLVFLKNYNYKYLKSDGNTSFLMVVNKILDEGYEENLYSDFMTYSWYDEKNKMNVINLTALAELIEVIKRENPDITNQDIIFIHDKIPEFETMFTNELSKLGIKVSFEDSKTNLLLQIADNAVSIMLKVFVETKKLFMSRTEWLQESEWLLTLTSTLLRKISISNIKFTVPVPDWAMMFCVRDMFSPEYPKMYRKNIYFNPMYNNWQERINQEQISMVQYAKAQKDLFTDIKR